MTDMNMDKEAEQLKLPQLRSMPYLARQKFPVPLDRDQVAHDCSRHGYSCNAFTGPPGRRLE